MTDDEKAEAVENMLYRVKNHPNCEDRSVRAIDDFMASCGISGMAILYSEAMQLAAGALQNL